MTKPTQKQVVLTLVGLLIVAAIVYGFLPGAKLVETMTVKKAPLQVIVEEEGETQVEEHYMVSSPITAYIRRIHLNPGEMVEEGSPLAELEPPPSNILDPRSRAEANARVEAAKASLKKVEAQADQAIKTKERMERLADKGSATREQVELAQAEAASLIAAQNAAEAELVAAQAVIIGGNPKGQTVEWVLRSPISGQVLAVHRKSEGYITPGETLMEIGDIENLEVRVDVLSQDAVRIMPGMRVILDQWGGEVSLEATVKRVEHQGKAVVSALGVEEQRVQVIAVIKSPSEAWRGLGSGFRVLAQFIIWEDDDVLQVPNSALFRTAEGWGVFVVENDKAVRREVSIGQQTGLAAQVLEGISEGEVVVVHPAAEIEDGVKVKVN